MKKLARLFLLWLIIVVAPVQGIAATTMSHCGNNQHHQAMSSNQEQCASHAQLSVCDSSSENSHATDSSAQQCSSCADCCIGCAMTMVSAELVMLSSSSEKIDSFSSSSPGHISDGLERPPRN